jgi:hypothetical protein
MAKKYQNWTEEGVDLGQKFYHATSGRLGHHPLVSSKMVFEECLKRE